MDTQLLLALSGLPRLARSARCIQRQIHVQPIRLARRLLRDFAITYPHHLSEFFPARKTLAIHRDSTGTRRGMNQHAGQIAVLDFEPANEEFCEQVIAELSEHPRPWPWQFSYD